MRAPAALKLKRKSRELEVVWGDGADAGAAALLLTDAWAGGRGERDLVLYDATSGQ